MRTSPTRNSPTEEAASLALVEKMLAVHDREKTGDRAAIGELIAERGEVFGHAPFTPQLDGEAKTAEQQQGSEENPEKSSEEVTSLTASLVEDMLAAHNRAKTRDRVVMEELLAERKRVFFDECSSSSGAMDISREEVMKQPKSNPSTFFSAKTNNSPFKPIYTRCTKHQPNSPSHDANYFALRRFCHTMTKPITPKIGHENCLYRYKK